MKQTLLTLRSQACFMSSHWLSPLVSPLSGNICTQWWSLKPPVCEKHTAGSVQIYYSCCCVINKVMFKFPNDPTLIPPDCAVSGKTLCCSASLSLTGSVLNIKGVLLPVDLMWCKKFQSENLWPWLIKTMAAWWCWMGKKCVSQPSAVELISVCFGEAWSKTKWELHFTDFR